MNHGIVFGDNRCIWIKDDGSSYEMELFGEYETAELLEYVGLTHFSTKHKYIVTFCKDVEFEMQKLLLSKIKIHAGHTNFFVADIHKVVFSGSYSIPRQKQVCVSFGKNNVQLFIFEKGEIRKKSWIRIQMSQSPMIKTGATAITDLVLLEAERYVSELDNDQIAECVSGEILKLVKTFDKSDLDQGIIGFVQCVSKYKNILAETEQFTKLPLISIDINFHAMRKYMAEVVKDKNIFEYVIKQSEA